MLFVERCWSQKRERIVDENLKRSEIRLPLRPSMQLTLLYSNLTKNWNCLIFKQKQKQNDLFKSSYNRSVELIKVYSSLIENLGLKKPNFDPILLDFNTNAQSSSVFDSTAASKPYKSHKYKTFKNNDQVNLTSLDAVCVKCTKKTDSHLLVDCDTCKNYYHITCLSPPLNSVPKKTKLYGWLVGVVV